MCYSSALTSKNVDLAKKYKKQIPPELPEPAIFHCSAFTHPFWRIITADSLIGWMQWGLIPAWSSSEFIPTIVNNTLNARSESLTTKPSFKHLVDSRRCVVPVNGFFEYQAQGKAKKPYFIYGSSDSILSLAGLYDIYEDSESGEKRLTFTIITCEANGLMAEIHNTRKRMPAILMDDQINTWLHAPNLPEDLLSPAPDDYLSAYPVNPSVLNGPDHNSPFAQKEYVNPYGTQTTLF